MTDTLSPQKKRVQQTELFEDKKLSRRGLTRYKVNPFVNDSLITQLSGQKNVYYTQNSSNAIIDTKTGEVEPVKLQIIKKIRADNQTFIKLYTSHLKSFFDLSQTANRVLQFVLYTTQETAINKDKIYLSCNQTQDFFIQHDSKISSASYYRAMKELVEKLFLAETEEPNLYFINPQLFFNGDRIEFLTQFQIEDKPMQVSDLNIKPNIDI